MRTVTERTLRIGSKPFKPNGIEVTVEDSGTGIHQKDSTVSLMRSSRRKPMAWGWGWQFAGWSSKLMAERCRYPLSLLMAQHFALLCRVLADASNLRFLGVKRTRTSHCENGLLREIISSGWRCMQHGRSPRKLAQNEHSDRNAKC